MKRRLTKEEINNLLSVLECQNKYSIPMDVSDSITENLRANIREQLETQEIYPSLIPKLKEKIEQMYRNSIIHPGETVGIIAGQSIGERQTQTNLNHFHKAGAGDFEVNVVSEFSELINATTNTKISGGLIYFKDYNNSVSELRDKIGYSIVEITVSKILKHYEMFVNLELEDWHRIYEDVYDSKIKFETCLRLYINMDILYTYKLPLSVVVDKLNELNDIQAVFSPDSLGIIDIFVDISEIDMDNEYDDNERILLYLNQIILKYVLNINVAGIPGIKNIYFIQQNKKWVVEAEGMNYKKVLMLENVDKTLTISNNIWDIYSTLGIEAVRKFMIDKFMRIVNGLNSCHIVLVVDKMLFHGTISSINRYSLKKDAVGVLNKATFEEIFTMFITAGVYGEVENLKGVSSSIICGKPPRVGTGFVDVVYDVSKLKFDSVKSIIKKPEEIKPTSVSEIKIGDTVPIKIKNTNYKDNKIICYGSIYSDDVKKEDVKDVKDVKNVKEKPVKLKVKEKKKKI